MRVRNLPWAKDYLPLQPSYISDPQEYKGKWKEKLHVQTLHLEIGSGKGDYWLSMSEQYPDEGWIGLERNTSIAITEKTIRNEIRVFIMIFRKRHRA